MPADTQLDAPPPLSNGEDHAAENTHPRSFAGVLATAVAIVAACFGGGLGAGLALTSSGGKGVPAGAASRQNPDAQDLEQPDLNAAQALELADQLLDEGNAQRALKLYRQASRIQSAPPRVRYRHAVALELMGQYDAARSAYHLTAAESASPGLQVAALLGVARCELGRGRQSAAVALLYELSVDPRLRGSNLAAAEAAYLLCHALAAPLLNGSQERLLDDRYLAAPVLRRSAQQLLAPAVAARTDVAAPPVAQVKLLYKVSNRPSEVQLAVSAADGPPVMLLVEDMLTAAGLTSAWSEAARSSANGRTLAAAASNASLAALLDATLAPLGLNWDHTEGSQTVLIRSGSEMSDEERWAQTQQASLRAARQAVGAFPDHADAPFALLAAGNLLFYDQRPEVAANQFSQVLQHHGHSDIAALAWFNSAKVHLAQRRPEQALEAFYRVFDGVRGGELRAVAGLYAGRIQLEQEQLPQAKRTLQRCRAIATLSSVRAAAALLNSVAHLREGNPHAANLVLLEQRQDLVVHGKQGAALLGAMARFQTATSDEQRTQHGRALVAALSHARPSSFFGSYGAVVIGEAYRELGFQQEMTGAYEMALEAGIGGAAAERITLELARAQRQQGNYADASRLYGQLAGDSSARVSARIDQAELEYEQRHDSDCLAHCRQLLQLPLDEKDRARILKLMGRAYRRQQDHYRAALCFSGLVPEDREVLP